MKLDGKVIASFHDVKIKIIIKTTFAFIVTLLLLSAPLQAALWDQLSWLGIGTSTLNQFSSAENISNNSEGQLQLSDTSNWMNSSWLLRKKISFLNSDGAVLQSFPVFLNLNEHNFDFTKIRSDCRDLRITDSDGRTLLPFMIETCDSVAKQVALWVKVPEIEVSNSDFVYLYFNNPEAADAQNPSQVWTASYTLVALLNQLPPLNRAREGVLGTALGIGESQIEVSARGSGYRFDGLNDYVSFEDLYPSSPADHRDRSLKYDGGEFTLSASITPAASETNGGVLISKPWNGQGQYNYMVSMNSRRQISFQVVGGANPSGSARPSESTILLTEASLPVGASAVITAQVTASQDMKIFVNGDQWASTPLTVTLWPPANEPGYGDRNLPLTIGTLFPYGSTWAGLAGFSFQGTIDDVSLSPVARSPGWIRASARQIIDPSRWLSFGATEMSIAEQGSLVSNIFCTTPGPTVWESANFHSNGQGTVTMKLRSSQNPTMEEAPAFSECPAISPGLALNGNICVHSGDRCAQYQLRLESNGGSRPLVSRVTVTYTAQDPIVTIPPIPSPPIPQAPIVETPQPQTPVTAGGAVISETDGSTRLTQGQDGSESYSIALTRAPTSNVTVTIIPDAILTPTPLSLLFTPENWNQPQIVNVSLVDRSTLALQSNIQASIRHSSTSADPQYQNISLPSLTVFAQSASDNSSTTGADTSSPRATGCSLIR